MKGTLKLKTDNGKLSAEYSDANETEAIPKQKYESSFQPITLSQEAEEHLKTRHDLYFNYKILELSGKDLDYFEIKDTTVYDDNSSTEYKWIKVLHLKPIVELDLDTGEYYIPENPIHAVTRRKPIVTPQINSKTKCPTCGSEVKIGGDGTSQFYIPTVTPDESEVLWGEAKIKYSTYANNEFDAGNNYLPLIEWLKLNFHISKK